MGHPKAGVGADRLIDFIKRVLRRSDLAPRHLQLLKTL